LNNDANKTKNRSQMVSVNGNTSSSRKVTSGIPQGSVLGPILFVIYINDMPDVVEATTYLFADDTKLNHHRNCAQENMSLQNNLDALQKWSDTWLLKFHPNKCKVVTISTNKGNQHPNTSYHLYDDRGNKTELMGSEWERDIGVHVDEILNFKKHMQTQIDKANSIMGLIIRT
jgi:hypothetical protein